MDSAIRWRLAETDYPAVRRVMGSDRRRMDDEALEDLLEEMFPGADPEDVENFMRTVQKFGQQAAPVFKRAAPGIMKGAVQGGMVGGPWGALAGGLGGGALSLLGGGGGTPARAKGPTLTPVPGLAAPVTLVGSAPAGGVGTAGSPAAAQLLALLSRPETVQALLSLLMGQAGRPSVAVGKHQVPAAAFANAIAELAAEAAQAALPAPNGAPDHLLDAYGRPRCDVANPAERAALLMADLAEAAASEEDGDSNEVVPEREWALAAHGAEEEDDPLDAYEAALEGEYAYDD